MKQALASLLLLLAAAGCSTDFFWAEPERVSVTPGVSAPTRRALEERRAELARNPDDLGLRFALACDQEKQGFLEAASLNYGIVANGLPAGRFTRPWLAFARVELTLDRDVSAERALREVLSIVPDDRSCYVLNGDYREAAVLLAPLLARSERWGELEKLRARFTAELGGDLAEWPVP